APPRELSESETLTVHGYVRSVRKQKRIAFAVIGDGSTLSTVQAVLSPQLAEKLVSSPHHQVPSADWRMAAFPPEPL
nr:hypothetical protein [Tanacetum cinerariifolium]